MHWRKVALVGVGLLGGSLGLALKQRALASRVEGYVRRAASVRDCLDHKVVDHATRSLEEAVSGADLVVLCTPIAQMQDLTRQMLPALKPDAIVTDVGSVKSGLVESLQSVLSERGIAFVGSHPMAGGERMGVSAARPDLFEKALCVVTPVPTTRPDALSAVEQLWSGIGARVQRLSPILHDELVARSSHLPHIVAAALANYVLSPANPPEQPSLCATGFRDTTRVASGSPEMWRDIAFANRVNLSRSISVLMEDLGEFRHALESGDENWIHEFFTQAKQRRDRWAASSSTTQEQGGSTPAG